MFNNVFPDVIMCDSIVYVYVVGNSNVVGYGSMATMGGAEGWLYFDASQQKIINGNWSLGGDCALGTTLAQIKKEGRAFSLLCGKISAQ